MVRSFKKAHAKKSYKESQRQGEQAKEKNIKANQTNMERQSSEKNKLMHFLL